MRKLVLDAGFMDDWFVLHEEPYRRINGADIEGTVEEWRAIADAIESGGSVSFKRCCVSTQPDGSLSMASPRNSMKDSVITKAEAAALVVEIRRAVTEADRE